jgi:hypothetical protein
MNKGMRGSETEAAKAKKQEARRKRRMIKQRWPHQIVKKRDELRTKQRIKKGKKT